MKKNEQKAILQKAKAVELLKKLGVINEYVEDLKNDGKATLFENYIGFWVYQYPELDEKLKWVERKYNAVVYAVTHEFAEFGEMYSFLIVPKYEDEWDYIVSREGEYFTALAYVWNKSDDELSELGTILLKSENGGIRRVG